MTVRTVITTHETLMTICNGQGENGLTLEAGESPVKTLC